MKSPRKMPSLPPSEPVRKLITALLGCIPFGGSMAQLLFDQVWTDPSYRLLRDYLEGLSEDIRQLQQAGDIDLEEILGRPETRPLLSRAIEAAARSVGQKKLQALRTATVQGVFQRKYPFDLSVMVFSLLDRITEGHIQMLQLIQEHQRSGAGGARMDDLMRMDLEYDNDGTGVAQPAQENGQYYDERAALINTIIMDDLLNMGLIAIDPTGYQLPNDFSQVNSGPRYLTVKGSLFYEHISSDTV